MRFVILFVLATCGGCSPWVIYNEGVPNFGQVRPGVFRSAQPTTEQQWATIMSHGVRHVIKLNFASEGSDDLAVRLGLDVHVLSIQPEGDKDVFSNAANTFVRPSPAILDEVERLLLSATPEDAWDVHCTWGHDRTGLAIGRDRVLHDGWTKDAAYREMIVLGFHPELHGLNDAWEDWHP
jgi:hypothetical protein